MHVDIEPWIAPPPGWIKVNFDATFDAFSKTGTTTAVARTSDGVYIAGVVKKIKAQEVLEAEGIAAELAILLALQHNLLDVILEGDNSVVVSNLINDATRAWNVRTLFIFCKNLLRLLSSWSVRYASRKQNIVAHNLAAWGKNLGHTNMSFLYADVLTSILLE
ncbi:hypothetical protein FRX31_032465 [Thalictrum thalictroides]|uniref:RNase H type-1 domain-containing protein n=1 Tax=Thalictrum thalictroides TaxID=46969 RepID=A0A7J6UZ43_THATH|nr:hypothetical protein FRX31_032465 [Thalictrum thalictroides]